MRKAPKITLEEFKSRMNPLLEDEEGYFPSNLPKKATKDIAKIEFDWENFDVTSYNGNIGKQEPRYEVLANGLPVLKGFGGGDWEWPVHFIFYWDGKAIRGYIPEDGNVYDRKTKAAHDGDDDAIADEDWVKMDQDIIKRIQII